MDSTNWNNWKSYLKELAEDKSQFARYIDTSSLVSKKTLPPELWNYEKMNSDVLDAALRIAYDFFDKLDIPNINIKDITLTGSLASYNWSDVSDFDLHILLDFNKLSDKELMENYFKEKTKNWNDLHSIMIKGYEVELYIQDSNEPHFSSGVYSLMENRWLKRPSQYKLEIDYGTVKDKSAKLMEEIDDVYDFYAEKDYILAKKGADALMQKIKRYRKSGLESGGIYSVENLVFKVLRRNDYIRKLSSVKTLAYDAMMSLMEYEKDYVTSNR